MTKDMETVSAVGPQRERYWDPKGNGAQRAPQRTKDIEYKKKKNRLREQNHFLEKVFENLFPVSTLLRLRNNCTKRLLSDTTLYQNKRTNGKTV